MSAGTHARTVFAGFGVSGSLLAAVGAAFVVAGGVLAFDQWPHDQLRASNPEALNVAAASPSVAANQPASQARSVALLPTAPAARPTSQGRNRGATRGTSRTGGRPHVVPVGRIPAVQATTLTPAGTGGGSSPVSGPATVSNAVADTVDGVAHNAATAVRSVGAALPAASSVTETVAGTTESAGALVSNTVRGLTGGR